MNIYTKKVINIRVNSNNGINKVHFYDLYITFVPRLVFL